MGDEQHCDDVDEQHRDDVDEHDGVGRRVRAVRKLAGLTQEGLAHRAHVSVGLVRQVEQGRAPASPAFVAAAARALDVSAPELMGQPPTVDTPSAHRVRAAVTPLRRELIAYRLPPETDTPARALDDLASDVARLSAMRHATDLTALATALPSVLAELRAATHVLNGSARERAYGLLAEAYYAADQAASKLGYPDLATVAVDRYEWAAAASGDELAVLVGDYRRAGELIGCADWAGALRMLQRSRDAIEQRATRSHQDAPAVAVWGNLHLKSGLAAARGGDPATADDHLAEAASAAGRIGDGRDDYRLAFGPTNVDIWGVGLAVEAMDGAEAVTRAERMPPPATAPRERVGHHHIDTARAYLLAGNRERTFDSLMAARRISPQQTRHHPQVHETVRVLAERDRRRSDTLAGFARWAGVAV